MLLRSRGRAVTAEDFEELARDVAPDAARVRCVAGGGAEPPGSGCWSCRTWPATTSAGSSAPTSTRRGETLERISDSLDERRLVGTRLLVAAAGLPRADRGGRA